MYGFIRHAALGACLFFMLRSPAFAADPPALPSSTTPEASCSHGKFDLEITTSYFPKMKAGAIEVRRALCLEGATREQILEAFALFVDELVEQKWFDELGGFQGNVEPLATVQRALKTEGAPIPIVAVIAPLMETEDDRLEIAGQVFRPANVDRCNTRTNNMGCGPILDEFSAYYNYAHNSFSSKGAQAFARSVAGLSGQWSKYLDSTRSMTPLELAINSRLYKKSETLQFSPPPRAQLIVLHPSVIIENLGAATDGEKMQEALMVEAIGANWWQQDKWYLPTGGSVVAVYADRPGIPQFGYGLAIHFRSVYSIGLTRHGSDSGLFISFDILKLVENKKKVLDRFNP